MTSDEREPLLVFATSGRINQNTIKAYCPAGHEYSEANTYIWGNMRFCRACNRQRRKERYWRQKQAAQQEAAERELSPRPGSLDLHSRLGGPAAEHETNREG